MKYIETSFLETPQVVSIELTRVYQAGKIFDSYLQHIIEPHRTELEGADLGLKHIYILAENENVVDVKEVYCSILFTITKQRIKEDNKNREIDVYTPCLVTCDNLSNKEECLCYLFRKVLTHISSDGTRLSIGATTLGVLTDEHVEEGAQFLLGSTIRNTSK